MNLIKTSFKKLKKKKKKHEPNNYWNCLKTLIVCLLRIRRAMSAVSPYSRFDVWSLFARVCSIDCDPSLFVFVFFVFHCTPKQKSFNLPWIVCATNYHATATRSRPFLLPTRRPSPISWSAARVTPSLINWLTKGKHSYSNNNWRLCWSNFPTTTNNREISFTPYPRLHPPFFWHALSSYSKTFSF